MDIYGNDSELIVHLDISNDIDKTDLVKLVTAQLRSNDKFIEFIDGEKHILIAIDKILRIDI